MNIEGQIHIRLDPGRETPVQLGSSRPQQVMRLLDGCSASEVPGRIERLYALCGRAQCLASQLALQAAGWQSTIESSAYRQVRIEALQEYLWRMLIDLPQLLHRQPALTLFAPIRKALVQLGNEPSGSDETPYLLRKLDDGLRAELLGMPSQQWLEQDQAELDHWLMHYPVSLPTWLRQLRQQLQSQPAIAPAQHLLPDPPEVEMLQTLAVELAADSGFSRQPSWQARQPETGALSYQQHNTWLQVLLDRGESPVLVRMLARLFELLQLQQSLEDSAEVDDALLAGGLTLDQGHQRRLGLGWVRTARGVLLHRVELAQDQVLDYQILAPTEWNFHPQGPLAEGLKGWLAVDPLQLTDWVGLQVLSLDPCVSYELTVGAQ